MGVGGECRHQGPNGQSLPTLSVVFRKPAKRFRYVRCVRIRKKDWTFSSGYEEENWLIEFTASLQPRTAQAALLPGGIMV